MQRPLRKAPLIALMSVLVALCLAIQLSPRPPNVEFTSLFTFSAGFIFNPIFGILFGCFIMFVNGFLSPWGFAGLNMPFQMAGMGLIGLAGGLYRKFARESCLATFCFKAAVLGAFLTVIYDLITNIGVAISYVIGGVPFNVAVITALAYGAPFSLIHVSSNVAVFGVAFLPIIKVVNKHVDGEQLWLRREH